MNNVERYDERYVATSQDLSESAEDRIGGDEKLDNLNCKSVTL